MRSSFRVSLKCLYRNIKYAVLYLALMILTNYFLAKLQTTAISFALFHLASLKLGIVGYLVFCFLGYEYVSLSRTCDIKETLESVSGSRGKLVFSQCLILFFFLLIWCLNIFCWILKSYFYFQVNYPVFFNNAILSAILDLVLPGLIAILLGAVLALSMRREVAYSIIVLSALFCSPVPSKLIAGREIFGYSLLKAFDWYAILAPNTNWFPDTLYGVSVEPYRWFLAIFWIMAFLSVILFTLNKGGKAKRACAICMAVISVLAGVRFMCRGGDSIVRKDYRPDGTLEGEFTYREENPITTEKDADFSVEKYLIDLTIKSSTKADVWLTVSGNELHEYNFTLYHGYQIKRIEDADKNSLQYERDGDYITVYAQNGVKELHFVYSGNAGKYYANYQGIALPGYLPYYPIPGHIKLWDYAHNAYVVNTAREMSSFEVRVDTDLTVASNLTCLSKNVFSGYSQAVSLYAGMQVSEETAGALYWDRPIDHQPLDLDGYKDTWKRLADQVGESSEFDLTGKTIFMQPETVGAASAAQEGFVEFNDHLIIGYALSSADFCCYHLLSLIPRSQSTDLLFNAFSSYLIYGGTAADEEVDWSDLEILKRYKSSNEIDDTDEWFAYVRAENKFSELFNYKVNTQGESSVLRSVYQYLLDPDGDQVDFLYSLGE